MKFFNSTVRAGVALLAIAAAGPAVAQTTAPLLQQGDLVYQGGFRLPPGSADESSLAYGGTAIGFNPANNSLFILGHDHAQRTAEVKIPALVNTSDVSKMATATLLQSLTDATEGKLNSINSSDPNGQKIGGHLVYNGKLYITGYSFYDGNGSQKASHFVRPLSLSTKGQVTGPVKVGSDYPGYVSIYMTQVPTEWQSLLGGPALTGGCCLSITSLHSNGPAVSVFDPARVDGGSSAPATALVGYPLGSELGGGYATKNDYFNLATKIKGIAFPTGTRSVLFFGRQGTGAYCYGDGGPCGDPSDQYKGPHAYPYVYQIWAYDANDLVAVKQGLKSRSAVKPYALIRYNLPTESKQSSHLIGGAAYDAKNQLIYVSQECADSNCTAIIHAFKVQGGGPAARAPNPPSGVSAQ
jgi:hypothetical protein